MRKTSQRNQFEALNHVLEVECLPALKMLVEICKKEEKIVKKIKNNPSVGKNLGSVITLKRALVCLLCIRITNIFQDKQGISFLDLGKNIPQDKIIKKMIRTRHTWFAHIGKETNDIVSGKEIVESDLENQLKNLSKLLLY